MDNNNNIVKNGLMFMHITEYSRDRCMFYNELVQIYLLPNRLTLEDAVLYDS